MKKNLITLSIFSAFDASALIANCDVNGGPVSSTPCLAGETQCHSSGFGNNSCQGPKLSTVNNVRKKK